MGRPAPTDRLAGRARWPRRRVRVSGRTRSRRRAARRNPAGPPPILPAWRLPLRESPPCCNRIASSYRSTSLGIAGVSSLDLVMGKTKSKLAAPVGGGHLVPIPLVYASARPTARPAGRLGPRNGHRFGFGGIGRARFKADSPGARAWAGLEPLTGDAGQRGFGPWTLDFNPCRQSLHRAAPLRPGKASLKWIGVASVYHLPPEDHREQ